MTMMRKTITIPDAMDEWVKAQIASGRYGNDSEYFRDLIRRDQDKRQAEHDLLVLIQEGLGSGVSKSNVKDIMQRVEDRLKNNGNLPTN
ncbi:MAG: type II toxin-antitoxin system ParD family antitoxin [Cyanomargarita calcarea GSE-NOS-MK-12-04C]|jgi:antitoxin ParD1/3/4|uniref:Type II toxin-antitoxin system ParD family antitoxin n=1 Tax=Cyanomargarita calcarea GSE-NOS-MK-12-04C TaxID=2839659 RepID=A0A951QWG3_9CYAN|nr:type II toxin-antitoxin system ParD family antitoxin [Cyanomargarita calcarea GSE-NOS-MK-12-04C]